MRSAAFSFASKISGVKFFNNRAIWQTPSKSNTEPERNLKTTLLFPSSIFAKEYATLIRIRQNLISVVKAESTAFFKEEFGND
jgi:hypothetical protein